MTQKKITIILVIIILIIIIGGVWLIASIGTKSASTVSKSQPTLSAAGNQTSSANYEIQGMKVEILKEGSGAEAKLGDAVTVNYTGTLQDGSVFDSSLNSGRTPFSFTLGQNRVIQGWELGVLGMKVGEKRSLTIPPELAYGSQGAGGVIPPNATLTFEIDMLGINQ